MRGRPSPKRMRPVKADSSSRISRKQLKSSGGQRDPDRTRAAVLSVARREFARLGLAGARVDEIVRLAGVSKQVVYYHFKSKDELFKAALLSSYEEIRANNVEYVRKASGGSPETRLRNLIVHLFDRIGSHREVISLIVEENRYRGQHLLHSDLPYRSSKPMVEHLSEALKAGQAFGLFKSKVDARQLYLDIFSMCLFYFTNLYTVSAVIGADLTAAKQIKRRRDHIVRTFMNGLAP